MKILVLNGPNMNLLGLREPEIYGRETYEDLVSLAEQTCREAGLECICVQSNHEGVLIDEIQKARDGCASIAIADALRAVDLPAVEVHISDPEKREPYRHISYTGMACRKVIKGKGLAGYREAILYLKELTEK